MFSHPSSPRRVGASAVLCLLLLAPVASAQDVPFAFLLQNGWKFAVPSGRGCARIRTCSTCTAAPRSTPSPTARRARPSGTGHVQAFTRVVPDPTFAPILPLAGLIELNLGVFRGHLTVFEHQLG